jgi:hypothetical protein
VHVQVDEHFDFPKGFAGGDAGIARAERIVNSDEIGRDIDGLALPEV